MDPTLFYENESLITAITNLIDIQLEIDTPVENPDKGELFYFYFEQRKIILESFGLADREEYCMIFMSDTKATEEIINHIFDKLLNEVELNKKSPLSNHEDIDEKKVEPFRSKDLSNWGAYLTDVGKKKEPSEAYVYFNLAIEKFIMALNIDSNYDMAYNNWGITLGELADRSKIEDAIDLFEEEEKKYKQAIEINPLLAQAYLNWGLNLVNQGELKGKQKSYFKEAFSKLEKAFQINPDDYRPYCYWGRLLSNISKTKSGREAQKLREEAIEKYGESLKLGAPIYDFARLYALNSDKFHALHFLRRAVVNKEVIEYYVKQDEDWKEFWDDEDFNNIWEYEKSDWINRSKN